MGEKALIIHRFFPLGVVLVGWVIVSGVGDCRPAVNAEGRTPYWVFFWDRGYYDPSELSRALAEWRGNYRSAALERRAKVTGVKDIDIADLPPHPRYIGLLEETLGRRVRVVSSWLNAVSILMSQEEKGVVKSLPFVAQILPVARFWRDPGEREALFSPDGDEGVGEGAVAPRRDHFYNYGNAYAQNAMVNIPELHDRGFRGEGVIIGVLDAGFNNLGHNCFRQLRLVAAYDFVNGDENVDDEDDMGEGSHGTRTLSLLAGLDPGRFVGAAPEADYILAKTENTDWERPVEEDYWVAGLEWMDRLGVDVVSSSLSYSDWYAYEDLDGATAVTTRAAARAAEVGIVVVNSMGNTGNANYPRSKMGAPADGEWVVSVGGVNRDSSYARFSSQGPTFDGRIKPEVVAQASNVVFASARDQQNYGSGLGTSFSTPVIAGLCALLIQANPHLTPRQVLEALRNSGHLRNSPDTLRGWGIPDGLRALRAIALQREELVIPLRRGWNLISFNLFTDSAIPFNQYLRELEERGTLEIAKDDRGRFYIPRWRFGNIPFWDYRSGYYLKMTQPDTLTYQGDPVPYTSPIPIREGWQMVAYYPTFPLSPEDGFISLLQDNLLVIVKDDRGNFFLPEFGFNNMELLHSGKGYYLKSRGEGRLRYPRWRRGEEAFHFGEEADPPPMAPVPSFFPQPEVDENNMSLLLLAEGSIRDGDEVAWMNSQGEVVGVGIFHKGRCGMAVNAGGGGQEEPNLWLWSKGGQELEPLSWEVVFGDQRWSPNGIGVWKVFRDEWKDREEEKFLKGHWVMITPNPANQNVEVKIRVEGNAEVVMSLYTVRGQELRVWRLYPLESRWLTQMIPLSHYSSGTYLLRVRQGERCSIMKVVHLP